MSSWEVDSGQKTTTVMEAQDIMGQLSSGNLGIYAKVRRPGFPQWTWISQTPEFHTLCPFLNNHYASNPKLISLNGNLTVSNDLQRLMAESARIRASPDFYNRVGFHAPIFDREFSRLVSTSGKIFRMWDNFWVAPLLTPPQASLGAGCFLLYLFALNTNTGPQAHELHPYDYPIPKDQTGNLSFALPPGGWASQKVRIPVSREKGVGVHTLTFRTATASDKVAKGVLVGALTLGSVVYKQGHRGFSISLRVSSPQAPPTPSTST